jgi:hypothetical protein
MASRKPAPEATAEPHAADIVRSAAHRGLGSHVRLRLFAVAAWCSFLGAALVLGALLTLLPREVTRVLGWAELSAAFLSAWLLVMVAVTLALMLAGPSAMAAHATRGPDPERADGG